jgi:hypothetical protein
MRTKDIESKTGRVLYILWSGVALDPKSFPTATQCHHVSVLTYESKVKMPAAGYEFPFVSDSRLVPCCLVRGIDEYGRNLLVNPPVAAGSRSCSVKAGLADRLTAIL